VAASYGLDVRHAPVCVIGSRRCRRHGDVSHLPLHLRRNEKGNPMAIPSDADLFSLPLTFMDAPYGRPGAGTRAAIVGLPFDCGTHPFRVGARSGPDAVREQSPLIRRFNPTHADFDPSPHSASSIAATSGSPRDASARPSRASRRRCAASSQPESCR
jgi:Arginase family